MERRAIIGRLEFRLRGIGAMWQLAAKCHAIIARHDNYLL